MTKRIFRGIVLTAIAAVLITSALTGATLYAYNVQRITGEMRTEAGYLLHALSLTEDEARELLASAGLFLLPRDRRDAIIGFFIGRGADIYALNAALYACGERQLFFI